MPGRSHEIEFRVRYSETDQMQVVYHANYLVWCEMGRTDFIRQVWGSYADLERAGVALAVVEANVRFHAPARYDEMVRVTTTLREMRSRSLTFDYAITAADGRKLATAYTTLVAMNRDAVATAMPAELRAALQKEAQSP